MELVDTRDLKSLDRNIVPVQVRPRVPNINMKKIWLIALYKPNEVKRLENNLLTQKYEYYLPKITTRRVNSKPKEEILFPGYIFINTNFENYTTLKYFKGIKNILKFGKNISYISDEDIKVIKKAEESSKSEPICPQIKIGQKVKISKGSMKGNIAKIFSLPYKQRVEVLLYFLGSDRRVIIHEKDLIF